MISVNRVYGGFICIWFYILWGMLVKYNRNLQIFTVHAVSRWLHIILSVDIAIIQICNCYNNNNNYYYYYYYYYMVHLLSFPQYDIR